jgi:type IV pilus assembly protein PilE
MSAEVKRPASSRRGGGPILSSARAGNFMRTRTGGFTLIELMITVAVVGILSAIAYPSYQDYVRRARRTDATRGLMEAASALERYFSQHQTYGEATLGATAASVYSATSPNRFYALSLSGQTATTYTLTATPQGAQAGDRCGNFTLDNLSVRGVTGALGAQECWQMN